MPKSQSKRSQNERESLFSCYQDCSSIEQQVLQVMAVIYGFSNRHKILRCLSSLEIKSSTESNFDEASFRPYIMKLQDKGLVLFQPSQGTRCNPLIAELITLDLIENKTFETIANIVQNVYPLKTNSQGNRLYFSNFDGMMRSGRIAFYQDNLPLLKTYIESYNDSRQQTSPRSGKTDLKVVIDKICDNLRDWQVIQRFAPAIYESILVNRLESIDCDLKPVTQEIEALEAHGQRQGQLQDESKLILVEQYLLRGQIQKAESLRQEIPDNSAHKILLSGWLACVMGDYDDSIEYYDKAAKIYQKQSRAKKVIILSGIKGIFQIIALLKQGSASSLQQAASLCELMKSEFHGLKEAYFALFHLIKIQQGQLASQQVLGNIKLYQNTSAIQQLFILFAIINGDRQRLQKDGLNFAVLLKAIYGHAQQHNYAWVASVSADLLQQVFAEQDPKLEKIFEKFAANLRKDQWVSWNQFIPVKEPWELSLTALANLQNSALTDAAIAPVEKRLVWLIDINRYRLDIEPKEQKRKVNGEWSKGRAIALRRLHQEINSFDYFSDQDRQICTHLQVQYDYNYYSQEAYYEWEIETLLALVGHPFVFWQDHPNIPLEIMKGEVQLRVRQLSEQQLSLSLDPSVSVINNDSHLIWLKETPTRLRVYPITAQHQQIAGIIGLNNQLTVPTQAKEQVLNAINGVANLLTIHSDIGGGDIKAREVEAQATPHVHLFPAGEGLKVTILVCPFGENGPYYHPNRGGELVVAEVEGERLKTKRNMEEETKSTRIYFLNVRC